MLGSNLHVNGVFSTQVFLHSVKYINSLGSNVRQLKPFSELNYWEFSFCKKVQFYGLLRSGVDPKRSKG